jgi:hypothetical protein
MILSYRREGYSVPLTSTCLIHTTGIIRDGDSVSVTSPVFASMNFTSGAINTSDRFTVPVKVLNDDGYISTSDKIYGQLHCDDNDTFNMYVSVQ